VCLCACRPAQNTHHGARLSLPDEGALPPINNNRKVHATIKVQSNHNGWAGWGAVTFYQQLPSGYAGKSAEAFHKVVRYRQGVVLEFIATGEIYKLDYQLIIGLVVSTIVLLGVAGTITDLVTFRLLPNGTSKLLANKRNEKVSRKRAFAELGVRTALAARQFDALDTYKTGTITFPDLVQIFGRVQDVTFEKATAIARTVLSDAAAAAEEERKQEESGQIIGVKKLQDGINRAAGGVGLNNPFGSGRSLDVGSAHSTSRRDEESGSTTGAAKEKKLGIDFASFMTILEGGSTIPFEDYMKYVAHSASQVEGITEEDMRAARAEYQATEAEAKLETAVVKGQSAEAVAEEVAELDQQVQNTLQRRKSSAVQAIGAINALRRDSFASERESGRESEVRKSSQVAPEGEEAAHTTVTATTPE